MVSTEHEEERHQGYLELFDPNSWCNIMPTIRLKKKKKFCTFIFFF